MMKTHRFDPISFVFGVGFLALAAIIALPTEPWDIFFSDMTFGWVWPAVVILTGLALLVPTLRAVRAEPASPDEKQ